MTDAADLTTVTFGGKTFQCSNRTAAHLAWTLEALTARGGTMRIYQGCYNVGVAASAGSHDLDAAIDTDDLGLGWEAAQRFLREHGWAAWWRHTGTWADPSKWHIHAVSLGYPGAVGWIIPGQVADYLANPPRDGLASHAPDPTWHPADIDSTIFDYPRWLEEHELNAAQDERLKAIETKVDVIGTALAKFVKDEGDRAAAEKQRDRAAWKRDLKIIKEMVENGATLDELAAYVDEHGQPEA